QRITMRRNNRVEDYLKMAARCIVNYCIENDIGTIVCGYNSDFKREIDLGKNTNQQFVQVSYGKLRSQLKCLCERYSMKYMEREESYTSKASFLDFDKIPVYQANSQEKYNFSGRRIYRGLYRSKEGRIINADVNGAANILRKSKLRAFG
ncbi:MAG: IS200/IS605 family accessory protein TnpB-related protein, partial [Selenomonadaceae bacterium]|nr:IS200/IS605 family accessory protein TnpB-related protein [Selenomonadaceae bacterium]